MNWKMNFLLMRWLKLIVHSVKKGWVKTLIKPTRKKIKILSNGPIWEKAGVMGPILTPYMEDIDAIIRLLVDGIELVEVLDNGKELPLTFMNCDKVNDEDTLEPATTLQIPKKEVVAPPKETKVDTTSKDDIVEKDEEVEAPEVPEAINLKGNKHNKRNK